MIRFLAIMALLTAVPFASHAQETSTFTILDLAPLNLDLQKVNPTPDEAFGKIKNEEMRSVLQLQNQITMLNALSNWQEQVGKLDGVYSKAGIAFDQPKPPREICDQVPPNVICGAAYPELAPEPPVTVAALPTNAPSSKGSGGSSKKKAKAKPVEEKPDYEWVSVGCAQNNCKATLVDLVSGSQFDVLQGESIDDGVMVQSVTAEGVTLTVKGKAQKLRSSNKKASSKSSDAPTGTQALQQALGSIPAAPDPAPLTLDDGQGNTPDVPLAGDPINTPEPDPAPAASSSNGGGDVGATGLF